MFREIVCRRWPLVTLFLAVAASSFLLRTPPLSPGRSQTDPPPPEAKSFGSYGKLPRYFEENRGQADRQVKFLARGPGYRLFLTRNEAILALRGSGPSDEKSSISSLRNRLEPETPQIRTTAMRMAFAGANPAPAVTGEGELPGKVNYFIGSQPSRWITAVPTYRKLRYTELYPGIDLEFRWEAGNLEFDFIVRPAADPEAIRLEFAGSERLELDPSGDLRLASGEQAVRIQRPTVYQLGEGARRNIPAEFRLLSGEAVGLRIGAYRPDRELVVDPVLVYSVRFGGIDSDHAGGIAVDNTGAACISGFTDSINFPLQNPLPGSLHNGGLSRDVFVVKLDASGSGLVYATYLGGSAADEGAGIALDSEGNACLTGNTRSADFPTVRPLRPSRSSTDNTPDAFIVKLDKTGSRLLFSSYWGGSGEDTGRAIAVDASGTIYLAGSTRSQDFPVWNALQPSIRGGKELFVTRLDPDAGRVIYSTYLGGGGDESEGSIAVDAAGNAYVAGSTISGDIPITPGVFQPARCGIPCGAFGPRPCSSAFVSKINPSGSALVYSTYLGCQIENYASDIAVDARGTAYIAGATRWKGFGCESTALPELSPPIAPTDAFVASLDPSGARLVYAAFLGGSRDDTAAAIRLDARGNAYVAGTTDYNDFPVIAPIYPLPGYQRSAFAARIAPSGSIAYSTYLGGQLDNAGTGIAVDAAENAYVIGDTTSTGFPARALSSGGSVDVFVTKIDSTDIPADLAVTASDSPNPVVVDSPLTYTIVARNNGPNPAVNVVIQDLLQPGMQLKSSSITPPGYCQGATCYLDSLPVGGTATMIVVATAMHNAYNPLVSTVRIFSPNSDPDLSNNAAISRTVTVLAPDLRLNKTHSGLFAQGAKAEYTLTVLNDERAGSTVGPITLTDTLPAGLSFLSAAGSGWSCSAAGQTVLCRMTAILPNGKSSSLVLTCLVNDSAAPVLNNTASVATPGEVRVGDNTATDLAGALIAGRAVGALDIPAQGQILSGTSVLVQGWAAVVAGSGAGPAARVELLVDGVPHGPLETGKNRPDVQRYFAGQGIAALLELGYNGRWNSHKVFDGAHRLSIRASDVTGAAGEIAAVNVVTSNGLTGTTTSTTATSVTSTTSTTSTTTTLPGPYRRVFPKVFLNEPAQATGLAILNLSVSPAALQFKAYSNSGTLVGSAQRTLQPGAQLAGMIGELIATLTGGTGWLSVESSVPEVEGFFLLLDSPVTTMDGAVAAGSVLRDFVLPVAEGAEVSLVNPGSLPVDYTISFNSNAGIAMGSLQGSIPALGRTAISSDAIRPKGSSGGYLRGSSGGLVPLELFGNVNWTAALNAADAAPSSAMTTQYAPQFVAGGGHLSTLDLINLESIPTQLTLIWVGDAGQTLGQPATVNLPASGAAHLTGPATFGLGSQELTQGYVRIQSNGGRFAGAVRFTDPQQLVFGSALNLVATGQTDSCFSQVAQDAQYFTGLAAINPGNRPAAAAVTVYDITGRQIASGTIQIPPGGRISKLLPELVGVFPPLSRGYFRIRSAEPLVTFALFGTHDGSVLAAIPAQSASAQ